MTPQQLRASLLQQALSGRLVPQHPEDGTADTLYEAIQQEKARLIAEKKIKKEKPLPPIAEEDIPYDIPENWKWVRLGSLIVLLSGTDFKPEDYNDQHNGIPYVTGASSLSDNGIIVNRWTPVPRVIANKGDILFVCKGSFGKTVICDVPEAHIARQLMAIKKCALLNMNFIRYFIIASLQTLQKSVRGVIPGIDRNSLLRIAFPLPPLAEQNRIAAKLEELLPLVDQYGDAAARLADYEARFPDDLRKSLLQEAITGRLVPQRPEDGTADALYEEIQQEKARLIAEKKIKKGKPLPPITEEEKPFDIPDTWKWIHLGDCGSWASGATPSRTNEDFYNGGTIPWLKTGDLNDGVITQLPEYITELALEKTSVRLNPIGSVLMAMYGATIGRLGILSIAATTNQACCACIPYTGINNKYLFYFLLAWRPRFIKQGAGGAQPNISKEKIVNTPFPLPPLAEQKRIVAKLEELLPLAERIRSAR